MMKSWVPYASVAAGVCLLAEAVITIGSGDEVLSGFTTVLWDIGMVLAVVAAIGYAVSRQRHRALLGVGLVLAVVAWVMGVGDLLKPVFGVFSDSEYLGDEGPIGLLGLVLLVLGARSSLTTRAQDTNPQPSYN